jgi:hypothetical protein
MRTKNDALQEADDRRYEVHGHLKLCFSDTNDVDIDRLCDVIRTVDLEMPWVDELGSNGDQSLVRYLGSRDDYPDQWDFDNPYLAGSDMKVTTYTFRLTSKCFFLRQGQLYAYEKHMAKLAEELAKRRLCNEYVASAVKITTEKFFEVPQ